MLILFVCLFPFVCLFVCRYAVAFLWLISLNIWHLYVYYKACKSDYGWPQTLSIDYWRGKNSTASNYNAHEDNVHAV
jgi:hypothetical protein